MVAGGDPAAGIELLRCALRLAPGNALLLTLLGQSMLDCEEYSEAAVLLDRAQTIEPRSYRIAYLLALAESRSADAAAALEHLNLALELNPDGYEAQVELARLYLRDPETAGRAVALMRSAYRHKHEDPDFNFELGSLYFSSSDFTESTFFLEKAVMLAPERPEFRLMLGKSLYHDGLLGRALSNLLLAAEGEPEEPEAHYYIGGVLLSRSQFTRAAASFQRALELAPGYRDALFFLGKAEYLQGLYERALQHLREFWAQQHEGGEERLDHQALAEAARIIREIETQHIR